VADGADGNGPSLQRTSATLYGNDPASWSTYLTPNDGTPGQANGTTDVTPPRLVSVLAPAGAGNQVIVTFSDTLDAASATVLSHYSINQGVSVTAVTLSGNQVTLTTSLFLTPGIVYTLTVAGVKNSSMIAIPADAAFSQATFNYVVAGTGLQGQYYSWTSALDQFNAANLKMTRTDATVNFDWGTGSPSTNVVPADDFAVRWTGSIRAPVTDTYTFYFYADDGERLWINGTLLIDKWASHSSTTTPDTSTSITLTAGMFYQIQIDYYEATGAAAAKLYWSSPSLGAAVPVASTYLYNVSRRCSCPPAPRAPRPRRSCSASR